MNLDDINTLLAVLLGGGAAATFNAFWKGLKTWREGASAKEDRAKRELADYREWQARRAEFAEQNWQYYQELAANYRWALITNGITPPELDKQPPVRTPTQEGANNG